VGNVADFGQAVPEVALALGSVGGAASPVSATNPIPARDLKDTARAIVNAATAIAGVTGVTTEAMLAMDVSRNGAATASVTTIAVTAGKTLRILALVCSARSTAAAVFSARVTLRMNPSGSVTATSPIIAIASMTQQAAALAEAGDTCPLAFPDGIEITGTMQIGLSQVCSAVTGVIYASLIGYEY
jgi:fructoselysine-6-P-deglycase FrlB-like protein